VRCSRAEPRAAQFFLERTESQPLIHADERGSKSAQRTRILGLDVSGWPDLGCEGARQLVLLFAGLSALHVYLFHRSTFSADSIKRFRTSLDVLSERRFEGSVESRALQAVHKSFPRFM
jgi:hypothetical protein